MDIAKKRLAHGGRQCHRTGWNIRKPPVLGKTRFYKAEADIRLSFGFDNKKKNVSELCPRFEDSIVKVSPSKKRSRSFLVEDFRRLNDKRSRVSDLSVFSKEEDIEGEIVKNVLTSTGPKCNVSNSEPKPEIDDERALRAATLKTRFAYTILKSQQQLSSNMKPERIQSYHLEDKKSRIATEIATSHDQWKQHTKTERKSKVAEIQNARFTDTILKAQQQLSSHTKPGRNQSYLLEDKKARIATEIATSNDQRKQHTKTERKSEAAGTQNALELRKMGIQKERGAFRKSLENMKTTVKFVDGRELQREFELFVGAPVTQFKRFTRDSAEYYRFYSLDKDNSFH